MICSPEVAARVDPELRRHLRLARDTGEWADHIGRLLAQPEAAAADAEAGRRSVYRLYSADAIVPMLEAAYDRARNG